MAYKERTSERETERQRDRQRERVSSGEGHEGAGCVCRMGATPSFQTTEPLSPLRSIQSSISHRSTRRRNLAPQTRKQDTKARSSSCYFADFKVSRIASSRKIQKT